MEDFSRYNGEGTTLRKAQMRMIDILLVVDKICRKHKINYWLDAGSLLGAVRHKGFIPWDDDLDISVLKKDYVKLKKILQEELPNTLVFQDEETEPRLLMKMGKVREMNSYFEESLYKKGDLKHQGIYIDIFPYERIVSSKVRTFVDFFYGRAYRRMRGMECSRKDLILAYLMWIPANIMGGVAKFLTLFMGGDTIGHKLGGVVVHYEHHISDILPVTELEFEGLKLPVPKNYDKYLREQYGDYMIIPPIEKREVHSSKIEFNDEV